MRKLLWLLVAFVMSFGTLGLISGAAHADTTLTTTLPAACGQGTVVTSTTLDVTSCAYAESSNHFDVSAATTVKVEGKQQLTYEVAHPKLGKLTLKKALKLKRVHITVNMSKKKVFKKYGNNACVVLTKGSTWTNEGKNGSKRVPFTTTVGHTKTVGEIMEVMCWKQKVKHWVHRASIVKVAGVKHLVIICDNWQTFQKVGAKESDFYIVPSPSDLIQSVSLTASTGGHENVGGNFTCPNGSFTFSGGVAASGSYTITVTGKASQLSSLVESAKQGALAQARINANLSYASAAVISLHVSCGGTPPPSNQGPSVGASANACVNPGETTGVVNVLVGNPNEADDTAQVTVGSQTKTTAVAAGSTASLTFSGYAPGTYGVTAHLVNVNKSATTTVTVNQCTVVVPAPQLQLPDINQLLENDGDTTPYTATVKYLLASGHQGNLVCQGRNGLSVLSGGAQSLSGNGTLKSASVVLMAPAEIPPADTAHNIPAGYVRLDCTLTQDDAQAVSETTNNIKVVAPIATP